MSGNMNILYRFSKKKPGMCTLHYVPVSGEDRWLPVSWDLFD